MESKYSNKEFNIWAFGTEEAYKDPKMALDLWLKYAHHIYKPNHMPKNFDHLAIIYEIYEKSVVRKFRTTQ